MRTYHPGKTPGPGQPSRAAIRTTTPAPHPHAAVHRPAARNVPARPGQSLPAPAQQQTQAQPGPPDFSRIPVHTDGAARAPATGAAARTFGPEAVTPGPGQPLPAPLKEEMETRFGVDFFACRLVSALSINIHRV